MGGDERERGAQIVFWMAAAGFAAVVGFRLARVWLASDLSLVAQTPDDAFYYFEVARNICAGRGSTFDGLNPTNGYHPLWMGICVLLTAGAQALAGIPASLELLPRVALTVQWILGVAAVVLLCRLARTVFGSRSAAALVLAGASTPWVVYALSDGMESGTVLLAVVLFLVAAERFRPFTAPPGSRDLVLGLILAAAFFARLDAGLLALALGIWVTTLRAVGRSPESGATGSDRLRWLVGKALRWGLPVTILGGGYLLANARGFDTTVPISGILKNEFPHVAFHARWLAEQPVPFAAGLFAVLGAIALRPSLKSHPDVRESSTTLAIFVGLQMLNTVLFTRWGVFKWHFTAYWPLALFVGAGLGSRAFDLLAFRRAAWALATAVLATLAVSATGQARFFRHRETRVFQAYAYRAARAARALVSPDERIGMTDCGVFGYYRGGGVVNLDGVMNTLSYQTTLRDRGLEVYLRGQGISLLTAHAALAPSVAPGYGSHCFRVPCYYLGGVSDEVTVFEKEEVYRSEAYDEGRDPQVFVIWRIAG